MQLQHHYCRPRNYCIQELQSLELATDWTWTFRKRTSLLFQRRKMIYSFLFISFPASVHFCQRNGFWLGTSQAIHITDSAQDFSLNFLKSLHQAVLFRSYEFSKVAAYLQSSILPFFFSDVINPLDLDLLLSTESVKCGTTSQTMLYAWVIFVGLGRLLLHFQR